MTEFGAIDNNPFDNKCPSCGSRRKRLGDRWAPVCHKCGREHPPPRPITKEQIDRTNAFLAADRAAREAKRAERISKPPTRTEMIMGWVVVILVGLLIFRGCSSMFSGFTGGDGDSGSPMENCISSVMDDRDISRSDAETFCQLVRDVGNEVDQEQLNP